MDSNFIYLDYNSTTPLDERVLEAMLPYFGNRYANPNSSHLFGLSVRDTLEETTQGLADILGGDPNNIVYTSGATEAINLAIKGLLPSKRKHIVALATEHKAVLDTCSFLEKLGYKISYLPVDGDGAMDLGLLAGAVTEETLLVCAMLANNETGVIHPVNEIGKIVHQKGALMLSDATQAVGKLPVDVKELEVDFLAFSAHKFYGPKGIGGLYISDRAKKNLTPQLHGGQQQGGHRSGTLNVTGIIGMEKAAALAVSDMSMDAVRIAHLRNQLEEGLLAIEGTFRNGHPKNRLYNTTNICFQEVLSEQHIIGLGTISVASGSACSSAISRPSHVLKAMGLSDIDSLSALRFSLGRFTTPEEIKRILEIVRTTVNDLRGRSS